MSLFISKTEDELIGKYPALHEKNSGLVYFTNTDGFPIGEFSSLLRYLHPDMFENVMVNVRKDMLEGGSILLYRKNRPIIITMVIQDNHRSQPQMSYIHTCLNKIERNREKINCDTFYMSDKPYNEDKQTEIKENFKNLKIFFI